LGYQIPDYTAYEDMIGYHMHRVEPVLVETFAEDGFALSPERFEETVAQGLDAYILSNPCNPTGQVIQGAHLASFVNTARRHRCTLILDEFYSHFIYTPDGRPGAGPVSAAAHVEDVNVDPVLIIDGLTKSFRYPGWRVGWVVGPRDMIENIGRAASAIDGGPSQPIQRMAQLVLEPDRADQETTALRQVFARKRQIVLDSLCALGVRFPHDCEGTFYVWGSIADLPAPFNDADHFFREALKRRVMTVPGHFFDVNPGQSRSDTRYRQWLRFSFGPPEDNVRMGLSRLTEMLRG
jgi:aspartate/methionine/tyrosine aminotransferase